MDRWARKEGREGGREGAFGQIICLKFRHLLVKSGGILLSGDFFPSLYTVLVRVLYGGREGKAKGLSIERRWYNTQALKYSTVPALIPYRAEWY